MNLNNHAAHKILLVDDDPGIIDLFKESLEDLSFEVTTAATGVEALELLKKINFHCLVTDIVMPKMSGIDLVKAAKDDGIEIPVFFITGYMDYPREQLNQLKPKAIIFKPFDVEEASLLIKNHLLRM